VQDNISCILLIFSVSVCRSPQGDKFRISHLSTAAIAATVSSSFIFSSHYRIFYDQMARISSFLASPPGSAECRPNTIYIYILIITHNIVYVYVCVYTYIISKLAIHSKNTFHSGMPFFSKLTTRENFRLCLRISNNLLFHSPRRA